MIDDAIASEREQRVERARASEPLDAAFIIEEFNVRHIFGKQRQIEYVEVVEGLDPDQIESLRRRARALLADKAYFGEKLWTGRSRGAIFVEMRERHPGFSQRTYEGVLSRGQFSSR